MTSPVLFLYDGSPVASKAIKQARAVLKVDNAIVLHVWEPAASVDPEHPWLMYAHLLPSAAELDRIAAERSVELAREGAAKAKAAGFKAEALSQNVNNSVWETAIQVAEQRKVSTIAVGSRRHSRLAIAVVGSVTHGLLMHAAIPVLVVPAEDRLENSVPVSTVN